MRIGLVGSASTAMFATPGAARDLCEGETFRLACQVTQQTCDHWYVLSAQHGLVAPDALITPDTLNIARMRTTARRAWAQGVLGNLAAHNTPATTWLIMAPPIYHEPALRGSIALPFDGANGQREMLNQLVRLRASVPTPTAPLPCHEDDEPERWPPPPKLQAITPAQRTVLAALHSNPQALTRWPSRSGSTKPGSPTCCRVWRIATRCARRRRAGSWLRETACRVFWNCWAPRAALPPSTARPTRPASRS